MAFNESTNRNKARTWTIAIHVLLLLWFAFTGLKYQDPPPEEGIAINFGYEESGNGDNSQAAAVTPPPPTPVETPVATPVAQEEVVTQDTEEAPVIEKPKEKPVEETPKEPVDDAPEEKPTKEPVSDPIPDPEPQPTAEEIEQQAQQAKLDRMFNTNNKGSGTGEGETTGGGDQGDPNGDLNSQRRTGNGGIGGNGKWSLGNRKPINKVEGEGCQESGTVVVGIRVDRDGNVTKATPGINVSSQNSKFTADCLLEKARATALKMKWSSAESDDPDIQRGYIILRFELQ